MGNESDNGNKKNEIKNGTGKEGTEPVQELPIDFRIPGYLQKDIRELVNGIRGKADNMECLLDELQGSINMAMVEAAITKEQAEILRTYYINGGIFGDVIPIRNGG